MTSVKIAPNTIMRNFLRTILTDISLTRLPTVNWIHDDWPRFEDLGPSSYPRISVLSISEDGQPIGMFDDTSFDTAVLQVDCWTLKDVMCARVVTDEVLGTMNSGVNTNRLTSEFNPELTVANVKHAGTSYGTITLVNSDAAFTAPGSLAADTVEISKETGNFNFSATDVAAHDGESITSSYTKELEGEAAVKHLCREVVKAVRNNWRTNTQFKGLFYPKKISGPVPVAYNEDDGVFRYRVDYQVNGFNMGEGC